MKGEQLALGVQLREAASFENFFAGPNHSVLSTLRDYPQSPAGAGLLIYGGAGAGKTHLLQALCREVATPGLRAVYLPLRDLAAQGPASFEGILEGLEQAALLCLDDIDAVLENEQWALHLLRLVDLRRSHDQHLVLAAARAPERLTATRNDLLTRLSAATVLGLKPLQDPHRQDLLRGQALARGLEMPDEVLRWLLSQLPRNTGSLLQALDQLDQASLAAQRRLTLPFVQKTVQALLQSELPLPAPAQTESDRRIPAPQ